MKHLTTLILLFSLSLLKAQTNPATPNAGFESWTHYTTGGGYDSPNNWNDLNPTTVGFGAITCVKDSSNPHSGKYDVRLITQLVTIITSPGALTTGTINTLNYSINGGLPYALRPDSVIGWFKYTSVSGDNGDCEFYLFGATHADTIGQAFFRTPTSSVGSWTRFSLPIKYANSNTPDTSLWIFSSSNNQANAKVGSQIYVDDLGLVFDSASAIKTISNAQLIAVGPNPTRNFISIENKSNLKSLFLALTDVTGRKVAEERITSGVNNIDLTGLSGGVYIYLIQDEQNAVIKTGKIVVQK